MKNIIVNVENMKTLIKPAPGFVKKDLADYKLDIAALCGFGCLYCSSNMGNYLRINQKEFLKSTVAQTGKSVKPSEDPSLMFVWPDVVSQLESELKSKPKSFGKGKTIIFSMLTDGFSPYLVKEGITKQILELMVEKTSFRIRVLTKNATVGSKTWVKFFAKHKDRFVVGLSTGSLDDAWSKKLELGTSKPSARFKALHNLQEAGVPTFGMLCPVFPDMMQDGSLEKMIDQLNPKIVEHIWAEPYNDRINWRIVRDSYPVNSESYEWFSKVFENGRKDIWSAYSVELYNRLKKHARNHGWMSKLKYLLYEDQITSQDARHFRGLRGVLLQSKPGDDGKSQNPYLSRFQ